MNSQYFSKEQVKAGELNKLLEVLMSEAYGAGEDYNDIHIYPEDLGAFIVEWTQVPWSHDYGGRFEFVDEDQEVLITRTFPDGHYDYFHNEEDYKESLADWLKNNSGWEQNEFGH